MGGSITVIRELPYLKSVIEERRDALRDVSKIDAERLDVIIQELNQCSDVLFLGKPSKLYFAVLGGTEKGTFWQWHIKIRIYKINQTTSEIESEKDLSLLGFCHFYHMMAKEMNSLSEDPKSNLQNSSHLSASTFLNEISELSSAPSPVGECCICMERQSDITLPECLHQYCEECFDSWRENNSICPLCRSVVTSENEPWLLVSAAQSQDISSFILDSVKDENPGPA